MDAVDWNINDEIAIASTDFDHNNSESRRIKKISADFKTIVLDAPLINKHYAADEQYDSYTFSMRAEVGLLTRNIVFQGSDDTIIDKYGAHLMIHMPGAIGRISFTEFRYVGQGNIIGRYPMHFHRIDDASDSFVIGNAVHESYARVVAIHDTHFLTVQRNVGYQVYGHQFFIEDGIESNNLIEDNLGISTIQIWTLINSDTTASTFWISNPNNIVRRNRAAGGDWFGFWYQLENTATGPSSNPDICPDGIPLGIFSDNVAHSFNSEGLRIYEYAPRTFPCQNHSLFQTDDFYAPNPPVPAVFENFVAWKNFENGVFAEHIGSIEFRNFMIADSRLSGIQISQTNFTREDEAKVNGAIIIGITNNKDSDISRYNGSVGFTTPRTDNLLVNNVTFYNFSNTYNMSAFLSCSECWQFRLKITGGKTTKFSNLAFKSVDRKIIWDGLKKEVFIDLDGSFLGGNGGSITAYYPHLAGIPECSRPDLNVYDDSVICNTSVQIRPVMFRNAQPYEAFRALEIRAIRIQDPNYNVSLIDGSLFTKFVMEKIFVDTIYSWALCFVTGYQYNVHFQDGTLDFSHMNFYPTNYWKPNDKGVVLRFNYSENRDDYNSTLVKFSGALLLGSKSSAYLDPINNNYFTGDYYLNRQSQYFYLGLNGKTNGTIDIDPVECLSNCNIIPLFVVKENFTRAWSNVSQWNNSRLPQDNEEVYIPQNWKIVLDVNTSNLSKITIDGDLSFDSSRPIIIRLTAGIIWVRLGNLTAGSSDKPIQNQVQIVLTGNLSSPMLLIDSFIDSSNKILAVTGALKLYSTTPSVIWTRLSNNAYIGDKTIQFINAVDWSVGNEIVIAPTEYNYSQHEKRRIAQISPDRKLVTLDSPLNFFHYGDTNYTYKSNFGQVLDMRGAVGLLTRKIQILVIIFYHS